MEIYLLQNVCQWIRCKHLGMIFGKRKKLTTNPATQQF